MLDFYAAADVVSPSRVSDCIHDALDGLVLREAREAQTLSQWIERLQTEPNLRRKGGEAASKRSSSGTGIVMRLRYGNSLRNEAKAYARLESYPVAALFFVLATTALRVDSSVKSSVSFGMLVTNGPTNQPRPVGISRVSEATSLCT